MKKASTYKRNFKHDFHKTFIFVTTDSDNPRLLCKFSKSKIVEVHQEDYDYD